MNYYKKETLHTRQGQLSLTKHYVRLLIKPLIPCFFVIEDLIFVKPQVDFPFSTLRRIRTVNDIFPDRQSEIPTDRSRQRFLGICFPHHLPGGRDNTLSLPDHGEDRSGSDKVNKFLEERFFAVFGVMFFRQIFRDLHELGGNKLVTFFLKARYDFTD